ncbi:UNVERIFIED_CONTAM: hypothetical protein GTU68_044140 [Idotea baltica]|nr:hypothetical protein [Idotea baltica]
MGENLVLNMASKGFSVAVYNRTTTKVDEFVAGRGAGKSITGHHSVEDLCKNLSSPRKVMIMVRAGAAIDAVIEDLLPHLDKGDVIIDGGNSHYPDSNRRFETLKEKGIHFLGAGVSGGEEGALKGPSIMPGGSHEAWEICKPILQVFSTWNKGKLDSFLIEITADIFRKKEESGKGYVVDSILDTAGQKGTGKWTAVSALELGMPLTLIGEAVFSRCLSALKEERVEASKILEGPAAVDFVGDAQVMIDDIRDALYCSKIVSYAQGFTLMAEAAKEFGWKLNYGSIAMMWRGGCIIRSKFLENIKEAFDKNKELPNLLLDPYFQKEINQAQAGWRRVVARAAETGIPVPAFSSALCYFDGYRSDRLPANLLQAQRDYFGAHTYERLGEERGKFHHTNWTGEGGSTASSSYNA